MTSSLLHLPSRAAPSPPPSSPSPVVPSPSPRLASASNQTAPVPGTAKKKQASLTAFLSPAAKQQQAASQAAAPTAAHSTTGGAMMTDALGGHSQEFIEQSWQQRLHGRQSSEPPIVTQQQISNKQQQIQHLQQQQQQKKRDKEKEQAGVVTKERGVKRPLEFPEDINDLLPPEWGGTAVKADKPKGKGKQKGKASLTAQYLHPDTLQHSSSNATQNRPTQLSSSSSAQATAQHPPPPPHTRPSAAAAVASANRRFEAQHAQQAQQAQSAQQAQTSSVPWFASNSSAARQQPSHSPVSHAHSFGDWLPTWGQANPSPDVNPLTSSASHQGRTMGPDAGALPLPVRSQSPEQRLGQLTAMHHKPALGIQSGDQQNANDSMKSIRGLPPSRSPSPVLMEDDEFDAQLNSKPRSAAPVRPVHPNQ